MIKTLVTTLTNRLLPPSKKKKLILGFVFLALNVEMVECRESDVRVREHEGCLEMGGAKNLSERMRDRRRKFSGKRKFIML